MPSKKQSDQEASLKDQIAELENLVEWFERDDIDIEEAIKKFELGTELSAKIQEKLSRLDTKITVLREKFDKFE
jgi:exodeoxyribonuclease VII small subunit